MNNSLTWKVILSINLISATLLISPAWADTVVQFNYNAQINGIDGPISTYQVQLLDDLAPTTVTNYLKYINNHLYDNTVIHRDVTDFVMQGGGYTPVLNGNNQVTGFNHISTFAPIQNEFSATRSNLRGTLAMAKLGGDPNSATSEWFVNLSNNSANLDNQNGGFTVFGQVVGEGMTFVDAVDSLTTYNLSSNYGGAFTNVPLMNASTFVMVNSVSVISTTNWKGGNTGSPTDWGQAANWATNTVPGVGTSVGASVTFGDKTATTQVDMVSAGKTVGNIYFSPTTATTIQSSGNFSLTLDNSANGVNYSIISALGNDAITAPVVLNNNVHISGAAAGSGTLNMAGSISGAHDVDVISGTVTLGAVNSFSGALNIAGGTVQAGLQNNLGANNAVNFNGGALQFSAAFDPSANHVITLQANGATLDTQANSITLANSIGNTGAGALTKIGSGTLTLGGVNTFTGAVNINAGTLNASTLNNLGNGTALNFNGGGLQFGGAFDPSTRTMTFQSNATLDTQANNITLTKTIGNAGAGGLAKTGTGSLTLNASPLYQGATNINQGTLKLASGAVLPSTTAVTLASGTILDDSDNLQAVASLTGPAGSEVKLGNGTFTTGSSNTSTSFAGTLTSSTGGNLSKVGSGTLTLSGANAFNGAVNFNGGLINAAALNNLGNGTVLNFGGGGLQFGGVYDPSTRTMNFLSNATLDTQANNITLANSIGNNGTGGLVKNGTGTLTLNGANTYKGSTLVSAGTLATKLAASLPGFDSAGKVTVSSGATLDIKANDALTEWTPAQLNSLLGNATFNSGSILGIDTSTGNFTYGTAIGSSLGLTKLGTNTLTLGGTNTFTGPININGGTINASTIGNMGNGTAINFNGGGLQFGGVFDPSTHTMTFQSTATLDTQANNITLTKTIGNNGAGGLTKAGSGILTLNLSPIYQGATAVNAGTLKLATGAILPSATAVTLGAGAILDVTGNTQTVASLSSSATDSQVLIGGGAFTTGNSVSQTFAGKLTSTAAGSLTKTGTGTFTLSGDNSQFTGTVNFKAGLIKASAQNTIDTLGTGNALVFDGGGLQFNNVFDPTADSAGRTITFNAGGATLDTMANNITLTKAIGNNGTGGLTKNGTGKLTLLEANTYTGKTTVNAGTLYTTKTAAIPAFDTQGQISVNNTGTFAVQTNTGTGVWDATSIGTMLTKATFNAGSFLGIDTVNGNFSYGAVIGGSEGLTKLGVNTLTLGGTNTFTGAVNINGGTINATTIGNLGAGTAINFDGGTLQFAGVFDPTKDAGVRTMLFNPGGATFDTQANDITLANSIGGSGLGGLTKLGAGTLTLSANNTFNGAVNFNGGLIKASALNNLGTGINSTALNFNGGGLQFGGVFDPSATRTMTFQSTATLDTQANNIILTKSIGNAGAGGLIKAGTGTLTLDASPVYQGPTTINGGMIQFSGAGVALPSTALSLTSATAKLDTAGNNQTVASLTGVAGSEIKLGNGTFTTGSDNTSTTFAGSLTSATGGSLTKTGTGTLTLAGALSYKGNTNINAGVLNIANGASSTLKNISGAGSLSLNAASTVTTNSLKVNSLTVGAGSVLKLSAAIGSSLVAGSSPDSSADSTAGSVTDSSAGTNVQPVPEPSTIILLIMGVLGLLAYNRRRKS